MTDVTLLRLGHRPARDKRMSTHVCLTARAFGAKRVVFPNLDSRVRSTVEDVVDRFGGDFDLVEDPEWRPLIREFGGPSLHLTMYGRRHDRVLDELSAPDELLVVVGSEKVPSEVYDLVTHNVAVGNQPHSEVAALATVLARVKDTEALYAERAGAEIVVEPSEEGKRVRET